MANKGLNARIGADDTEFQKVMNAVGRTVGRIDGKMKTFGTTMQSQGKKIQAVGVQASKVSAGIGVAVAAIGALATSTAASANLIDKQSKSLGLSSDAYQELGFAIGQVSNLSSEQFDGALRQMVTRMGQAAGGSKSMIESFEKVGITQEELINGSVSAEEAFMRFTQTAKDAKNPSEAMGLAAGIMGEEAAKLGPIMMEAGDQIDGLRAKAHELGIVMTAEQIAGGAVLTDQLDEVTKQFGAMKDQLGASLIPLMTETLIPLLQDKLIPAFVKVVEGIVDVVKWFENLPAPVQEFVGVITAAFAVGGPILVAIGMVMKTLGAFVAVTGPVGLLIAAAVLLTVAWVKWGDDIKELVANSVTYITEKFDTFLEFMTEIPTKLIQIGKDMIQGLLDGINEKWEDLKAKISEMADMLPEWLKKRLGIASPSKVFRALGVHIGEGLVLGIDDKVVDAAEASARLADAAVSATDGVGSVIGNNMTSALSGMIDRTKSVENAFKSMAANIIKELYDVMVVQKLVGSWSSGKGGGKGSGTGITGMLMGFAGNLLGFEGGGSTGTGPRSGGVDGRGGFPVIVHPNETIIDHTKGQTVAGVGGGSSVTVIQNNTFGNGVNRSDVEGMLPRLVEASKAAVFAAQRRTVSGR